MRRTAAVMLGFALIGVAACQDGSPTGPESSELTPPSVALSTIDQFDISDFEENRRALIGKFTTAPYFGYPDGLDIIYEVAVDQLRLRNGDSHKVWFVPESSKGLVVFVRDRATGQGVTNSAPNVKIRSCPGRGTGSFSFTDENVPFSCSWRIGNGGNAISGSFDLGFKRGRPGTKAINATNVGGLDSPESGLFSIDLDKKTFSGSFTFGGAEYTATVIADQVKFRNGSSHREYVIPESHKLDSGGFSDLGGGYRITCPFQSPGAWSLGGNETFVCTWKAGYGNRPSGSFEMS